MGRDRVRAPRLALEIFAEKRPELLFVGVRLDGNQGRWRYQMTGNNAPKPELHALIDWCRAEGIPTIFWNKEDPVNFETFIDTADVRPRLHGRCRIARYRQELGHDRVDAMAFAAQPQIHNPIQEKQGRLHDVVFAGMYFRDKHPERREQMNNLLDPRARPAHLRPERHRGRSTPGPPSMFRTSSVSSPSTRCRRVQDVQGLPRRGPWSYFPTMCARRVFELSACSTSIVSGWSRAIEETFGSLIPIARDGSWSPTTRSCT